MAILGTKKFWKPAQGATASQKENQILKNSGYINLQLVTVNYMSKGNFWQNTFGGKDKIALATTLKYQSGVDSIEATNVQDMREVKVNQNYNLGLQRNIAVKIPANADAISIDVKMTAVKDDLLQAKFELLNQPEYKSALQLAPTVVGQVLTITSLTKKLFTDSNPNTQLEASYGGIISSSPEENPVSNGKLTKGLLIMISTNDGDPFSNVDESKFDLRGDTLYYDNKQVENTYLIFNISFEVYKGDNQNSDWFKKYNEALNLLDKIQLTDDQTEIGKIYRDSKTLWIEGNALIDADETYLNSEKIKIKATFIKAINKKYNDLVSEDLQPMVASTSEIVNDITIGLPWVTFKAALPTTGSLLQGILNDGTTNFSGALSAMKENESGLLRALDHDTDAYLSDLKQNNIQFKLK